MIAAGIDLGGSKIEAQVFAPDWSVVAKRRVETPKDYEGLVACTSELIDWVEAAAGKPVPVGISAAGLVSPDGLALTANLPATGRAFQADLEAAAGTSVCILNDCRAFTLSEAIFGAAKGGDPAVGLILGTGIGGGVTMAGRLVAGHALVGGEFGHVQAPAAVIAAHRLPIFTCGCGRVGCVETYVSGPGLSRLAQALTRRDLSAEQIARAKSDDPELAKVWSLWCEIMAELLMALIVTIDPEVIVLGGGLSRIAGVADDLSAALAKAQFRHFPIPRIALAEGGDASGARGAAYLAWQTNQDHHD